MHYRASIKNLTEYDPILINYTFVSSSLDFSQQGKFSGIIEKSFMIEIDQELEYQSVFLPFEFQFNPNNDYNTVRFLLKENRNHDMKKNVPKNIQIDRYNETYKHTFKDPGYFEWDAEANEYDAVSLEYSDKQYDTLVITPKRQQNIKIKLTNSPSLKIEYLYKENTVLVINEENLLNYEHLRSQRDKDINLSKHECTFGAFRSDSEYYNSYTQSEMFFERENYIFGPQSIGLDIKFMGITNLYGIPEHPGSLRLLQTWDRELEPYRLFNIDAFEHSVSNNDPLYGSIPFMLGVTKDYSIGVFNNNPSDTDVDIKYDQDDSLTHWIMETGDLDFIVFIEDSPANVMKAYTDLTGTIELPLLSSLGYHQSRWSYESSLDVLNINENFKKNEIPVDFFWLDLDYTNDKKFFTWMESAFPNDTDLLFKLDQDGKKNLVTNIDPNMKLHYYISEKIRESGLALKDAKMKDFISDSWSGESLWLDFLKTEESQQLWEEFYKQFLKSATDSGLSNHHAWNNMNEPSLFKKFERTLPLNVLHNDGFEHRSVHNLYGKAMHEATFNALKVAYKNNKRPFVLSRSFFAGSQRTAASWIGDNFATWEHLRNSIPMILNNGLAGMPNTGADVAGFYGNPDKELLVRWYQLAVLYPFFRAHAHLDTNRREPYLLLDKDPIYGNLVKESIQLRYKLLNYIYNEFEKSSLTGEPIMKPLLWKNYDSSTEVFMIEDQFYLGNLLIKPVTTPNCNTIDMYFPESNDLYYNFNKLDEKIEFDKDSTNRHVNIDVDIHSIPIFIEGGSMIYLKERTRRSSSAMKFDNYTLIIAPDKKGTVKKTQIYYDDGETYDYKKSDRYVKSLMSFEDNVLIIDNIVSNMSCTPQYIEKIIVLNPCNENEHKVIENLEIPVFESTTSNLP
ncbi:related to Glucosidase 2 subunit alpha [Hanseniaspora guilliermondii]|uniref:Glucosidase II subunit alpha n=1 Tax=Hanseniaspora guilliermondii TaxID=56406 RepID=A0A1L0B366_9ASCO|nr:related to Glucosidase 2 subunit alpha [Hanseniaspora guilliermondii]